jgi:lycopene cyclase domain-containing protein
MIYSDIAITAFAIAVMADLFLFKNSLLTRPAFWTSYAIILPFQLITNWWLTSKNIVMYNPEAIVGLRIFSAPAEDLLFGFALIVGVMDMWEFWGRRGMQRDPRPNRERKTN